MRTIIVLKLKRKRLEQIAAWLEETRAWAVRQALFR